MPLLSDIAKEKKKPTKETKLAWEARPQELVAQYIARSLSTGVPAPNSVKGLFANKVCNAYILYFKNCRFIAILL